MGILEKIQEIEREIARTQKNKATEYHLGLLKAKLAKYRVSFSGIHNNIFDSIRQCVSLDLQHPSEQTKFLLR